MSEKNELLRTLINQVEDDGYIFDSESALDDFVVEFDHLYAILTENLLADFDIYLHGVRGGILSGIKRRFRYEEVYISYHEFYTGGYVWTAKYSGFISPTDSKGNTPREALQSLQETMCENIELEQSRLDNVNIMLE